LKRFKVAACVVTAGLVLVVFSCSRPKAPEGVLSQKEMVQVLTEIYLTEDKIQRMGIRVDSANKVFKVMRGKIEERTGIPDSVFRASLRYYMERPREMEKIYTILVDSLNLKEQRSSFGAEEQ
jgi:hypothetical protein